MKIVDLTQSKETWHAWRRQGLTASAIAAVLGYDEHKTPWRVWAEYVGRVEPEDLGGNPNIRRGVTREDWVRQRFEDLHDEVLLPCCVESDEHPVFRASLDGLSSQGIPVELKAPALSTFNDVLRYGRVSEPYLRYWPQVQHQIYVTEADHGYLCFYCPEAGGAQDYAEFRIERDEAFIRDELVPRGLEFWALIERKKEPPKDPLRDVFVPAPDQLGEWQEAVEAWRRARAKLDRIKGEQVAPLEAEIAEAEDRLAALMGEYRMAFAFNLQVTRFSRQGTIDYKRIVQEHLPQLSETDLERYRRPPGKPQVRVTEKTPPEDVARREAEAQRLRAKLAASFLEESVSAASAW